MRFSIGLIVTLLLALCSGCAKVPAESITLSENVGTVIEELRLKNAEVLDLVFEGRKAQINQFVDEVYAPAVIADAMKRTNALGRMESYLEQGEGTKALRMMEIMVTQSINRVEKTRGQLLEPLQAQHKQVKAAFDANFGVAIKGTETTTGLLRSIREVHSAQEQILGSVGIKNAREKINAGAARASDQVGSILKSARSLDTDLEEMLAGVEEGPSMGDLELIVRKLRALLDGPSTEE